MLLPPEVEYQLVQFPTVEQLSTVERQAIPEKLPQLAEVVQRISRNYLGRAAQLGAARLLTGNTDLQPVVQTAGPSLAVDLGDDHYLMLKLDQALANACIATLVGAPATGPNQPHQLTSIDRAILRPYLATVATNLARTIFHHSAGHQEFLEPDQPEQLTAAQAEFGVLFPMSLGQVSGQIAMIVPVAVWRNINSVPQAASQRRLSLDQLGQVPIRLEAVIAGVCLSLTEISTLEPGDVVPLPEGSDMTVHLRAGPCTVATGRPGTQAQHLAVCLAKAAISEETN